MHHTGRVVSRTELVEHLYDQDFDRDFEHHRGVRRPHPQEARRRRDPDRARARLSARRRPSQMRANSLALRLFALRDRGGRVVILLVTGVVLSSLYRDGVERSFDRRLGVYLQDAGRRRGGAASEPATAPRRRWASRCSSCRCRAGTGRSRGSTAPKPEVRSSRSLWDGGLPHLDDLDVADGRRRDRARATCRARRTSGCAWSSAPSISARTAAILVAVAGDRAGDRRRDARLRPR